MTNDIPDPKGPKNHYITTEHACTHDEDAVGESRAQVYKNQ